MAARQDLLQLRNPARDAGFDRAEWNAQNIGDLLVGVVLEIEQRQRRLKGLIELRERMQYGTGVQFVHAGRWNVRQILVHTA